MRFVREPDERPSGLAFAEFESKEECLRVSAVDKPTLPSDNHQTGPVEITKQVHSISHQHELNQHFLFKHMDYPWIVMAESTSITPMPFFVL